MKIEGIRKCVWISECAPGLARKKVLILSPKAADVRSISSVGCLIKIPIDKSLESVVAQRLTEFHYEPRRPYRNR